MRQYAHAAVADVMERAAIWIIAAKTGPAADDVPIRRRPKSEARQQQQNKLQLVREQEEKLAVKRMLREVGHNRSEAARKLGISRTTLYKKIRKHQLI